MKRILKLLQKHKELILYVFFGAATTLVNYLVYFPLYNWLCCSGTVSNAVSWVVSVIFAYLTNKPFVFQSHDWSAQVLIPEALRFFGCRVGSGAMETIVIFITVDLMGCNGNILKILTSVFVVLLNYIASKWLVFRKEEKG